MTNLADLLPSLPANGDAPDPDPDADELYTAFAGWVQEGGISLYPHQEEALLELVTGANVILATPTGSGKSLVATGAHFFALADWERSRTRSYYTAPIKALVSEKFFALCDTFGAANVGMLTGDAAVNAAAPLVCCTAEILANLALREGEDLAIANVVMDEFHFYSEPDRGWAWQVPLLALPQAQFLLMSATLGDVSALARDLSERTGRPTATVAGAQRPVPLTFAYAMTPLHETLTELLATHQAPVYVVHFTQAAALEQAQALMSLDVSTRAEKDAIAARLRGFRFAKGFGATLSRLVRHGIGVHHAGMLPKYRRLVETLAQDGLLKVVCGTDTLGVGINVPIRTVVLTGLGKFDGSRRRLLKAREFHQIAGRAGRAGFDTTGSVVVQAPDHAIENHRALLRAGDDAKKRRKVARKKPPEGFVDYAEQTFERLVNAPPEAMVSRMRVTHAMVLAVIERDGDAVAAMRRLLTDNHEDPRRQARHQRQAVEILRSLLAAGVVRRVPPPGDAPPGIPAGLAVVEDLQRGFALNQPLSTFALAALELLDPEDPGYPLDVVSVIEATLEDPVPILRAQASKERGEAVAQMKADGLDYDERMELLEDVSWPRPLEELLQVAYESYRRSHPWLTEDMLSCKSIVRDLYERGMTFGEYVAFYSLARAEGVVLRYLSDAYKALRHTVPDSHKTEGLRDVAEWLGELVRQTDSSLLDEWEALTDPDRCEGEPVRPQDGGARPLSANERALRVGIRTAMWRRVELAALGRCDELAALDADAGGEPMEAQDWREALAEYAQEYGPDAIGTGPDARGPALLRIGTGAATSRIDTWHAEPGAGPGDGPSPRLWHVEQILDDPDGDRDWRLFAEVDLDATDDAGELVLRVTDLDRL